MTDLFKSKENEFYIELKQERYYFPGDDISGIYCKDKTCTLCLYPFRQYCIRLKKVNKNKQYKA